MAWMCSWCGAPHEENDPPCEYCGHGSYERPYVRRGSADGDPDVSMAWVCTDCGRPHPRHSPPCSRCGGMSLEHREVRVDPDELSAGGFADLATRGFVVLLVVAVVAAGLLGLGVLGVVDLPGVDASLGGGGPSIPDAPGSATEADGTDLAVVADDYLAAVNDARAERGAAELRRTDDLDELATAYNRWWVRSEYRGEEIPGAELREHLSGQCRTESVLFTLAVAPGTYGHHDEPGGPIAERALSRRGDLASIAADRTGVDVHAGPDGRLYLTQVFC